MLNLWPLQTGARHKLSATECGEFNVRKTLQLFAVIGYLCPVGSPLVATLRTTVTAFATTSSPAAQPATIM